MSKLLAYVDLGAVTDWEEDSFSIQIREEPLGGGFVSSEVRPILLEDEEAPLIPLRVFRIAELDRQGEACWAESIEVHELELGKIVEEACGLLGWKIT